MPSFLVVMSVKNGSIANEEYVQLSLVKRV